MIGRGTDMLRETITGHYAVPASATYSLEMVHAVTAAAERTGRVP